MTFSGENEKQKKILAIIDRDKVYGARFAEYVREHYGGWDARYFESFASFGKDPVSVESGVILKGTDEPAVKKDGFVTIALAERPGNGGIGKYASVDRIMDEAVGIFERKKRLMVC